MYRRSILQNRQDSADASAGNRLKGITCDSFESVDDFLKNASIHGLKYIGQRNRSLLERYVFLNVN